MTNLSTTKATSQRHEKALDKLPHNNSKLISNNYNFDNVIDKTYEFNLFPNISRNTCTRTQKKSCTVKTCHILFVKTRILIWLLTVTLLDLNQ